LLLLQVSILPSEQGLDGSFQL